MPEVPKDLVKLSAILEKSHNKPSRTWWDTQIAANRITAYKIPGERGMWLSQAAVDELLRPHPVVKGEDSEVG